MLLVELVLLSAITATFEAAPVTSPVTLPSTLATSVPVAYPVPVTSTVLVGSACRSLNSFHLPESEASLNKPPYTSWEPVVS